MVVLGCQGYFSGLSGLYNKCELCHIPGTKLRLCLVQVWHCQRCSLSLFVVHIDKISRLSFGEMDVWFGNVIVSFLLFADDVVLIAPSDRYLKHALEQFAPLPMQSAWTESQLL